MLVSSSQPRFIRKNFTDASGRQFRLTFLVALVDGEMKGRLVSAEPIAFAQLDGEVSDGSFYLPIAIPQNEASTEYVPAFTPVASPYFSLDFLIHSQPTRAPSCK